MPARSPATCVPWPYPSVAVVAPGFVTTEAMTREVGSVCEARKSGSCPAIPVSSTATVTPAPVAGEVGSVQALSSLVASGNAVASARVSQSIRVARGATVGRTGAFTVTARTRGFPAIRRSAGGAMRTPRPRITWRSRTTTPPAARTVARCWAARTPVWNWTMATEVRGGCGAASAGVAAAIAMASAIGMGIARPAIQRMVILPPQ